MGKIVKAFFHIFFKSLFPNASYYHKILNTRFVFSLKYFLSLIFFFNLIFIIAILIKFNPITLKNLISDINQALSDYPKNLVINIKEGRLISNLDRPYFSWLKKNEKTKLLLVIDESATAEKINQYNSFLLLTSSDLVIKKNLFSKEFNILPLNYFNSIIIDKKKIEFWQNNLNKLSQWLSIWYLLGTLILLLVLPLFSLIITVLYLIFAAFFAFLIFKILAKKSYHFKKIFQISLHAVTFPLVIDYSLLIFQPTINLKTNLPIKPIPFPLLFLILLIIFVFAGVYESYQNNHSSSVLKLPHERRTKNSR